MPFLPKIYALIPQPAILTSDLDAHLDRCVAMGFDHVLFPMSPDVASLSQDRQGTPEQAIGALAQACKKKKLQLLVDLDMGSSATNSVLVESHPHWFAHADDNDDLPDPRRPIRREPRHVLRYDDPQVTDQIVGYWRQRLLAWIDAGVAGFRCMDVGATPAFVWKTLIDSGRGHRSDARFLAWTLGATPEQLATLNGCGFDATFSSGAWWDYRSRWLAEEQERLRRIAPPIAFPDSPTEPVIERLAGGEEGQVRRLIYQRALRLAAATGNGILIPMGFEYGLSAGVTNNVQSMQDWSAYALFDLTDEIAQANTFITTNGTSIYGAPLHFLSGPGSGVAVLLRHHESQGDQGSDALLVVANADASHECTVHESQLLERAKGFVRYKGIWTGAADDATGIQPVSLGPAELQLFAAQQLRPILLPAGEGKQAIISAASSPRIAIEAISPSVDEGLFPVKRTVGESVNVEADVFIDGHDKLAVALLWRAADDPEWHETRMHATGNDRWAASLPLTRIGQYHFAIEAWRDAFATYRDELEKKTTAGLNVSLELEEGRLLVESAARYAQEKGIASAAGPLKTLAQALKAGHAASNASSDSNTASAESDAERIAALLSEPTAEAMRAADARPFAVRSQPVMRIDVERRAARFSSWYELFPRSQSGDPKRHGTFDDVIRRLPEIQAMGFDTLYFPPIHPIGRKHRKGRNNSLTPGPEDPGSPYAIGSEEGGHDAIHPELGTIDDFRRMRDEAARHGLELALDFAIQCSPDHPWLKEHPDWFAWRPDGSIRYAENPPKKYQDIVNVDFYADGAIPGLWAALRDSVLFWVKEGVRVFRVDNPHTKPLPFWEWMIRDIRSRYPDTIFLSEAFTRPKMMYRLAKVGYSQSYTYFTWRHTKEEFTDYMTELTTTNVREYFRPHFFVNTPDINPYFLQRSGRTGFLIRAALATTLSGLWGMYSGFELCEGTPVPGKEEYLDSEKYEIRAWDWHRPGNIIAEITQLNRIRKENPALQSHLGIRFLNASNDNILYFIKSTEPADSCERVGDNVILVAINLDPFSAHEATLELPLWEFGVPDDGALDADDLISGGHVTWHGKFQHLRLDPYVSPYAIWRIRHRRA